MDVRRTLAASPVRNADESSARLLEMAGAWGGVERVGDLGRAQLILRPLILDRVLEAKPIRVEYGPHILEVFCAYEADALVIDETDEELPSRVPHPSRQDVAWMLHVPCPGALWEWASIQVDKAGIASWCKLDPIETESHSTARAAPSQERAQVSLVDMEALRAALREAVRKR